ncbi:hypothetical protein [Nocardioides sp. YIM 152588]|uniref:hypothetical protein n=1 Tax=Nocardioides sp. YIM 152588 TaxID=3158259 RepID=UPI0032E4E877
MSSWRRTAPWIALGAALLLLAAAIAYQAVTGVDVHARNAKYPLSQTLPPWHGYLDPRTGPGTVPALALALAGVMVGGRLAATLPFGRLVALSYVVSLGWLLALVTVDGTRGLTRVLGHTSEYLRTARRTDDVPAMLAEYVDRIPHDAPDNWPVHLAGHPPGAVLFFILLVRIGLGGDLAAGLVVTVVAASIAPAVLLTLRALDATLTARRAAPFLVLTPAAVTMSVSADAVMAAVAAWATFLLALAATRAGPAALGWAVGSGLLFGYLVMMSYGLVLFAAIALAVLVAARTWRPLVPCALAALAVVLVFAALGFAWWEAFPVLRERYWDGVASERPTSYWIWGNLAALVATAGPVVAAGLARLGHAERPARWLVVGAVACIVVADLSLMSKAEVERIWLPFVPWLTLAVAGLPDRWLRPALALQVATALVVQHLLNTFW